MLKLTGYVWTIHKKQFDFLLIIWVNYNKNKTAANQLLMNNALIAFTTNHAQALIDTNAALTADAAAAIAASNAAKLKTTAQNAVASGAILNTTNDGSAPADVTNQVVESKYAYNSDKFIIPEDDANKQPPDILDLNINGIDKTNTFGLLFSLFGLYYILKGKKWEYLIHAPRAIIRD